MLRQCGRELPSCGKSGGKLIKAKRQSQCTQACTDRIAQTEREIAVKPKFGSIAGVFALRRSDARAIRDEWRIEFARDCNRSALANIRKLFWAATLLNGVALFAYDLPLYFNGLFEQYRMYGDLVVWRLANIVALGGWLLVARGLGDDPAPAVAERMIRIAIPTALVLCVWHAVLSQTLAIDVSIYALVLFVVAGMIVTPSRDKLIVYPLSFVLLVGGIVMINPNPLVVYAIGVNAFCLTACAMLADEVWYRAAIGNFVLRKTLTEERGRADDLLRNILPGPVADRLKRGEDHVVEFHDEVSVMFADVVGFTQMATELTPARLIQMLETLFKAFDEIAETHGVEKIKTVGDAYMAAAGVPFDVPDHADRVARMALAMLETCERIGRESGIALNLRIGIDAGPAISGVIAQKKFAYDLWGDTVNTASRMETSGAVGRIHVTDAFRQKLGNRFQFERRGPLELKGKGVIPGHFLICESTACAA